MKEVVIFNVALHLRDVSSSIDSTICDVHFALSVSSSITLLHSGIEMIQAKKRMHRGSFALEVSMIIFQRTPG